MSIELPYPEVPMNANNLRASPQIHPDAWVAPGAVVMGNVKLDRYVAILFGCVLRGDLEPIEVGEETNIQDLSVLHTDHKLPCIIGKRVTIGHRAIVHGAIVEDEALIAMGAVVLSGAKIGRGALVAAGAVIREGQEVPARTLVAGVPAKIIRELDDDLAARVARTYQSYRNYSTAYKAFGIRS